MKVGLILVESS